MTVRKIAAAAGLALAAEAFMIPSTISLPSVDVDSEGAFSALRMPDGLPEQLKNMNVEMSKVHEDSVNTRVMLDCPGCSFRPEDVSAEAAAEMLDNELVLDFSISDDRKSLDLNGAPIYPFSDHTEATARQSALQEDIISTPRALSYASGAREMPAADGTDARLIDMFLSINGLGKEPIHVNNIDIRMLADEAGTLHLVHIITAPSHDAPPNGLTHEAEVHNPPPASTAECAAEEGLSALAGMMCRLRAQIKEKVQTMQLPHVMQKKPCPGMLARLRAQAENIDDPFSGDEINNLRHLVKGGPNKFLPFKPHAHHPHSDEDMRHAFGHHGHHGHHRHHSFVHHFARALRGFVLSFVVPVLIGVIAGMTASLLGMMVGTMIAWAWVKFVRGGRRGSASVVLVEEEEQLIKGDKDGVMEAAPAYEEVEVLPVYVEKE